LHLKKLFRELKPGCKDSASKHSEIN